MALSAIGAEQLRRCLARSEILRRRRRACKCRRESKNENRDLLHVPATPGFPERPLLTHSGGGARLFFRSRVSVAPLAEFLFLPLGARASSTICLIAELADRC